MVVSAQVLIFRNVHFGDSFFSLRIDIMEVEAAQYATITRDMAETGSYLEVYCVGKDYLDKPPLLFWLSSLKISLFGNTNILYKQLPVLLMLLSIWAIYRFTRL